METRIGILEPPWQEITTDLRSHREPDCQTVLALPRATPSRVSRPTLVGRAQRREEIPAAGAVAGGAARSASNGRGGYAGTLSDNVTDLSNVSLAEVPRFSSTFGEFDRVLGGGLVPGSAVLLGGHPGAGKSTLLLQTACKLAQHKRSLYVTGEESRQADGEKQTVRERERE